MELYDLMLKRSLQVERCLLFDDIGFHLKFGDFILSTVYQAIVNVSTGNIYAYEALLRVKNIDGSIVSPDTLFSKIRINRMELLRLDLACVFLHTINYCQYNILGKISINFMPDTLSYLSTHNNVWEVFKKLVMQYKDDENNLDFKKIIVEVTECIATNSTALKAQIIFFKNLGFTVAVDDFGSGSSNQVRLNILNPDIVKLDKDLLIEHNYGNEKPLFEALKVAREMGANVVLEGIETEHDFNLAKYLGMDFVQGFYLNRPSQYPYEI